MTARNSSLSLLAVIEFSTFHDFSPSQFPISISTERIVWVWKDVQCTQWFLIMNKMLNQNIFHLLSKLSFCAKRASSRFHASGFSFIDSKYVGGSFYGRRLTHFQTIFFLTGVHKYAEQLKRDVRPKSKALTRKSSLAPRKRKNIICT